jgi:hypothetical protein
LEVPLQVRRDWILFGILTVGVGLDAWNTLDQVAAHSPDGARFLVDRTVVLVGAIALLAYATFNHRRQTSFGAWSSFLVGSVCGCLFFVRTLGTALLDPSNIAWLMNGDWAQHYSGWAMFRELPWTWPPGALPALWYPVGTSIVYTDSLPLLALPLKLFDAWLPQPFQYIGLWLALSCILQGAFGALLVRRKSASPTAILAGCLLFVYAPTLLIRIGHDTLTAHWLLLAALYLYFLRNVPESALREAMPWWLLMFCAALVHPYLTAMIAALVTAYVVRRVRVDHARSWREGARGIAIAVLIILGAWWISGAFRLHLRDGPAGGRYGIYTSNLLAFVNSGGFSRAVPPIPGVTPEQWEGFAYLGLGVIGLAGLLITEAIVRNRRPQWPPGDWPLIAMTLLLFAYAASTVLTLGPWNLIDWPIKSSLLATFRSSGRFVWIPYYVALITIIWQALRVFPRAAAALLAAAFAVQAWEFSPVHLHYAGLRTGWDWPTPTPMLNDPGWEDVVRGRHHLTMLPPEACGKAAGPYLPFQMLAIEQHLTFNSGYLARTSFHNTLRLCKGIEEAVAAKTFCTDDVYVVGPEWTEMVSSDDDANCRRLDSYLVCVFPYSKDRPDLPRTSCKF